ncbi:hypothetical protein, partial [Planotetraspora phitsanulokensis]|uniref:hypothetical protein n=1 Tax=Planotetraspora phitsanulokensis TaxID=575192 RepID=UPI003CD07F84
MAKRPSGHQLKLNLPFMSIQVRQPEMRMPHMDMPHISKREVGQAVDIARTFLPPPERIVYYGGLGALAVLGLIEWPVAAAIGAGTIIAQRTKMQERWSPLRAQRPTPPKTTRTAEKAAEGAEAPAARKPAARRTTARKPTAGAAKRTTARTTTGRAAAGRTTAGRATTARTAAGRATTARTAAG